MHKLLIIDLFNLIHRAYHALPKEFTDSSGNPTNAIYGVSSMLLTVMQQIKPDYACIVSDSEKPTFRHEDFTGYKAHRRPMEDALSVQIPKIFEIIDVFGIRTLVSPGYEADDLVGAVTKRCEDRFFVLILSNDRDLWQMVKPNVSIMLPSTKGDKIEYIGEKEVLSRLGVLPHQVPDYKGLVGDHSDNIPGVYGIGEKTGSALISKYGSLEEVYENIASITPDGVRKKLIDGYDQAVMSKKLATLDLNTPVDFSLDGLRYSGLPNEKLSELFTKYNFKSLSKRLGVVDSANGSKTLVPSGQQGLFG